VRRESDDDRLRTMTIDPSTATCVFRSGGYYIHIIPIYIIYIRIYIYIYSPCRSTEYNHYRGGHGRPPIALCTRCNLLFSDSDAHSTKIFLFFFCIRGVQISGLFAPVLPCTAAEPTTTCAARRSRRSRRSI